ncbi:ATP-binding cassette domain-containing protein [Streptomyces sp. BPTC-684]|uniref:ABC transporter ATP-binding protein n=1 Tax=Streptomyces sp. BPTC-684 TaxID=3043734 RepID=UPI0024B236D6|nr:ATP-binding cassette domain-containing protein [Streptomyces sp. BPTC-684]WHM36954.1 ATP-binding cassette domain-containing protein [Streptomyces sp. BPTC-684]
MFLTYLGASCAAAERRRRSSPRGWRSAAGCGSSARSRRSAGRAAGSPARSSEKPLAGVDLTIEDGGRLVIQGPTGGGKSTLLQMLGGLDRPTEGSVVLDGVDLASLPEVRLTKVRAESIGFVFQSFNLIPTLTAQENVETALVPLGLKAADRREHWGRVAIARAVVKRPKVLLAGEPTGNLDEGMRDEIMEVLEGLWKEHGLTFVMVTHDTALARRAPRIAVIRKGKVTITENASAA